MKLVLLPGLDGSGDLFEHFEQALAPSLSIKTVLYPFKEGLGYDVLTEYVRDILPEDEPYMLLAESFSGPIAVSIATEENPAMKGLILVNTFLSNPNPLLIKLSRLLPDPWLVQPPNVVLHWLLSNSEDNAVSVQELNRCIKGLSANLTRSRLQSVAKINVTEQAKSIDLPVMLMQSRTDALVKRRVTNQLKASFEQAEFHQFKAGHFLLQTQPTQSARAVQAFIDKHAGTS